MPELDKHDLSAYGNSYYSDTDSHGSASQEDSQMSYYDKDADEQNDKEQIV